MKRRLLIIGMFLLLGAVVNVGVAWGSAAWHYVAQATRIPGVTLLEDGSTSWMIASYRSRVAHRMHSVWGPSALLTWQPSGVSPTELARGWIHILAPDAADEGEPTGARVFDGRGWPMISMWSALELKFVVPQTLGSGPPAGPGKVTRVMRGIELAPYSQFRSGAPQHQYRVLPLGIICSGFAVNTVVFAAIGLLLLVGLYYSRLAIRAGAGRCPACAYDLRHAEHDQCPECGGLVTLRRIGSTAARRFRLAVVVAWSCLALAAIAGGSELLWPRMAAHNWDAYKPSWWLVAKARSLDEAKSGSALSELVERIRDDELPDETVESLVREALAIQADVEHPWVAQWGDVVTAARARELVSDEDWRAFARQAIVPELVVRPRLVEGDPVAAEVCLHKRGPSDPVLVLQVQHEETCLGGVALSLREAEPLDGEVSWVTTRITSVGRVTTQLSQPRPVPGQWSPPAFLVLDYTGNRFMGWRAFAGPFIADVAPGPQAFETTWKVVISEGTFTGGMGGYTTTAELFNDTIKLQADVEVLRRGSQTVELVRDQSLRPAVIASLKYLTCTARRRWMSDTTMVSGRFDIEAPPMDLAFDVFVRAGEREWAVGQIDTESEHPWDFSGAFSGRAPGLRASHVDMILRSSPAAARQTLRITRIWDGEIVFENVPLRWDD